MRKILIGAAVGISTSVGCTLLRLPNLSASLATLTVFGVIWATLAVTAEWFFRLRRTSRRNT